MDEFDGHDWPAGGRDPFGRDPGEGGRFYWSSGRPSRLLPAGYTPSDDELYRAIPMGYTTLTLLERLALVAGDERLAWPEGAESAEPGPLQRYQLMLPRHGAAGHLLLGAGWPLGHAVGEAVSLSAHTGGGPVVLARVLGHRDWH
jgi:hypothetical protein